MIKKIIFYPPILAAIAAAGCISLLALMSDATSTFILWMIPTFGASVVLITALPNSPLARPKNIIFGHLISAASGVLLATILIPSFYSLGIAVGLAIFFMMITDCLHPPAGGNPILVILSGSILEFNLFPLAVGVLFISIYAVILNKIILKRDYPWF
jgi:CBS-domain-containing membrane protein